MKVLRIFENNINDRHISEAVEALKAGEIIIYPTDSVYAFGADALNKKAIEKLCRLKGLDPEKNLLSIVCSDFSQASEYARIDNNTFNLIKNYLPGPFTFILSPSTRLPKAFKNRKTIGLRIPDNNIARKLAEELGNPILSGSVNIDLDNPELSTQPETIAFAHGNNVSLIIDGGVGGTNMSTLVDVTDASDPKVLRQGCGNFQD